MGLLGYRRGSIRFQGKDLKAVPTYAISRLGFGFMPEDRRLVPELTVEENILVPAWAVGSSEMEKRLELVYWMIPEVKASRIERRCSFREASRSWWRSDGP